jgi:hypothetical protein
VKCFGTYLANLLDLRFALIGLQRLDRAFEEVLVVCEARVLWNAVVVLASKKTRREWRPDSSAVLELVKERSVLNFEALAVESIVLRLLGDRCNQVVSLSNLTRLHDLRRTPFTRTPVVGQIEIADDLCETLDNLSHRCPDIWSMSEHNIHVRLLETLERALQTLHHMLPRQSTGVGLLATRAEEDFGGEDVLIARPVELLERLAHLDLALAVGVDFCSVEEVDAMIPRCLEAFFYDAALLRATVCQPATEREDRHFEA